MTTVSSPRNRDPEIRYYIAVLLMIAAIFCICRSCDTRVHDVGSLHYQKDSMRVERLPDSSYLAKRNSFSGTQEEFLALEKNNKAQAEQIKLMAAALGKKDVKAGVYLSEITRLQKILAVQKVDTTDAERLIPIVVNGDTIRVDTAQKKFEFADEWQTVKVLVADSTAKLNLAIKNKYEILFTEKRDNFFAAPYYEVSVHSKNPYTVPTDLNSFYKSEKKKQYRGLWFLGGVASSFALFTAFR